MKIYIWGSSNWDVLTPIKGQNQFWYLKSIGGKVRTGQILRTLVKGQNWYFDVWEQESVKGLYIPPDPHPPTSSFFQNERNNTTLVKKSKQCSISIFKSLNPKPYFKSYKIKLQTHADELKLAHPQQAAALFVSCLLVIIPCIGTKCVFYKF
jgi:hypothetical protein